MDLSAEKTQREMLFHARIHERESELVAFIEEQEGLITAEEESGSYLRTPAINETPRTKEELEDLKYVPGMKKDV